MLQKNIIILPNRNKFLAAKSPELIGENFQFEEAEIVFLNNKRKKVAKEDIKQIQADKKHPIITNCDTPGEMIYAISLGAEAAIHSDIPNNELILIKKALINKTSYLISKNPKGFINFIVYSQKEWQQQFSVKTSQVAISFMQFWRGYDIEKCEESVNFNLWQIEQPSVLKENFVQQGTPFKSLITELNSLIENFVTKNGDINILDLPRAEKALETWFDPNFTYENGKSQFICCNERLILRCIQLKKDLLKRLAENYQNITKQDDMNIIRHTLNKKIEKISKLRKEIIEKEKNHFFLASSAKSAREKLLKESSYLENYVALINSLRIQYYEKIYQKIYSCLDSIYSELIIQIKKMQDQIDIAESFLYNYQVFLQNTESMKDKEVFIDISQYQTKIKQFISEFIDKFGTFDRWEDVDAVTLHQEILIFSQHIAIELIASSL